MIVRSRPNAFRMLFSWRGSILPDIMPQLVFVIVLSIVLAIIEHFYPHIFPEIPIAAFSLIGIALSIFLGFRNNACYDRWWEARKQWGGLIVEMRNFARESRLLPDDVRKRVLYRAIGFSYQLNTKLRKNPPSPLMQTWFSESEYQQLSQHPNPADFILQLIYDELLQCLRQGQLSDICYQQLSTKIEAMSAIQTACERIQSTPLPFAYSLLLHRTAYLYSLLLPIGLGGTLGFFTPIVVGILAYTFFGLDAVGNEIEEPFGSLANHLPLDAMVRTIEIDIRSSLGEADIPVPLKPVNFVLS
jgi:putative membrane protein